MLQANSTHTKAAAGHETTAYRELNLDWERLCERYLPVVIADSIWRHSRTPLPEDPEQGWKLHIPATVLSASKTLETIGPFLKREGALFKAPSSLHELSKLNSGIFYGYSQVGKFLTIYPRDNEEAVRFAKRLHQLTRHLSGPAVPFDQQYRSGSLVFYRYGAFKYLETSGLNGESAYAIRDPKGNLEPDIRDSEAARPEWVSDIFSNQHKAQSEAAVSPLKTTFRVFRALAQRGRGGVYQAIDLSRKTPRLCIVKEGRTNGEVAWDGRDGAWRVRHEERLLQLLRRAGINVPSVYASFEAEQNYYLVVEFIKGRSVADWLIGKQRRLPIKVALKRAAEITRLVAKIHAAGWVWRDCKPGNFMIDSRGQLRAVDFEGACPVDRSDPLAWGTPSFMAPEVNQTFRGQSRMPEDLYALGAMIYLLISGRLPDDPGKTLNNLRRGVPPLLTELVESLLSPNPNDRPEALQVAQRLDLIKQELV